ncbi:hypothetical protein [Hoeflea sp.]|uniref:hypothetical protein n=1 Tax=Hoeflea sp. TaxID=1940281 RepID=UPI003B02B436
MRFTTEFAILAPVPEKHLISGKAVCEAEGEVAFGSKNWELFRTIDDKRGDAAVPVLIYPSKAAPSYKVQWVGLYVRHVDSRHGTHPDKMKFRPQSTEKYPPDNKDYWAVFWHVAKLEQLPKLKWLPISNVKSIKGGWRKNAPPHGPVLVAVPSLIEFPE